MMQDAKISTVHRQRLAVVYIRQSSPTQLERNRESTLRQYQFVARAIALGWEQVPEERCGRRRLSEVQRQLPAVHGHLPGS